jgi:hypothetical protein
MTGHADPRIAVTLYADRSCLDATKRQLAQIGAEIVVDDTDRGPVLRTTDPDGLTVEIRIG